MTNATLTFLTELFNDKPEHLSIVIWSMPSKATDLCANIEQAVAAAEKRKAGNVYFGVSLHDAAKIGSGSRGDGNSAAGLVGLWLDLDVAGPTHKGDSYPPTTAAAKELLTMLPVQPTLIVHSGGGMQPWWLFKEPWVFEGDDDKAKAAAMAAGWQEVARTAAQGKGWQLDNTSDIARVLRVPGTFNRKSDKPIPVTFEMVGGRYDPSDFEQWQKESRPSPMLPPVTRGDGSWRTMLARSTLDFLAMGAPDGERNNRLFRAACDLAGCGAPYPEAAAMLDSAAGKCGLDAAEAKQTIDEAYSKPRSPARTDEVQEVGSAFQMMEQKPEGAAKATAPVARVDKPLIGNILDSTREIGGEQKPVRYHIPAERIAEALYEATGGWPRSVNGALFTYHHQPDRLPLPRDIQFLQKQAKLFAYIHETCCLRWTGEPCVDRRSKQTQNPIGKDEFFEFIVRHPAEFYESVEVLPQEPAVPETWYAPIELPAVEPLMLPEAFKVSPLGKLLDAMNADTPADKLLLLAAMMTPGWGGMPGCRPAFVFASDYGRGSGKTTTAEIIAEIWGGYVGIRAGEEQERILQRLLAPSSLPIRIALMDNIKGHLSDGILESIITAKTIDGHQLHVGQTVRRNTLTWFLTANTPMLSKDLAERSVVIKIGRQSHGTEFKPWALSLVMEHRKTLMAQLLYLLRKPVTEELRREYRDRWLTWQNGVLCKLANPNQVMQVVIERRGQVDSDAEQAQEIAAAIVNALAEDGRSELNRRIFDIPRQLMHKWMTDAGIVEPGKSVKYATTVVRSNAGSGPLAGLEYIVTRQGGLSERVWRWRGQDADPDDKPVALTFEGRKWQ